MFTGVFGCRAATASKWYDKDMRTLEDVIGAQDISLTKDQKKGMFTGCIKIIKLKGLWKML